MNVTFRRMAAATAFALASAPMALAADLALVISNPSAFTGRTVNRVADGHAALVEALDAEGYEVVQGTDPDRAAMIDLIAAFEEQAEEADRLLIHFAGAYFADRDRTYLLPPGAETDSQTAAATQSVPLSLLLDLAATRPTESIVALGLGRQAVLPGGRATSTPGYDIPQGVMVIRGGARDVLRLLTEEMMEGRRSLGDIDPDRARVAFEGLVLPGLTLIAPEDAPVAEDVPLAEPQEPSDFAEDTLWALARNGDNDAAYRLYLQRYPEGKYAADARAALGLPEPGTIPTPQEVEDELGLNRSARRAVQSNLTVLGFNTRGVDGIFGAGSRTAIRNWQLDNDFQATGYLDRDQVARLSAQADIRREELRIEEERRAREERQADDTYWRQTGITGREEDLRTYLNRYPEGRHAADARAALEAFEVERRRTADEEAFAAALAENTMDGYTSYLRRFPEGLHAQEARGRIDELRQSNVDLGEVEQLRDQERALGLNVASALVIEQRLRALGYEVGTVDGRIDRDTREAIVRFQDDQDLTPTGYLNTATIQRLIVASSR